MVIFQKTTSDKIIYIKDVTAEITSLIHLYECGDINLLILVVDSSIEVTRLGINHHEHSWDWSKGYPVRR